MWNYDSMVNVLKFLPIISNLKVWPDHQEVEFGSDPIKYKEIIEVRYVKQIHIDYRV